MAAPVPCACGNVASIECGQCGAWVCSLCVRDEGDTRVCIKCKSGAIKRAELDDYERAARRQGRSGRFGARRVRRRWLLVPATLAILMALLAVAVVPLLDAASARAERRAQTLLLDVVAAEERLKARQKSYGDIDELRADRPDLPASIAGYDIRLTLSRDKQRFWIRAIPRDVRLRALAADERGRVVIEGGDR